MDNFLSDHLQSSSLYKKAKNGIDIAFQNISYKIQIFKDKKKKIHLPFAKKDQQKVILRQISGIFKSGKLSAIMGASGAGKTTLLNILACRIHHHSHGKLYANNLQYSYNQFGDFANYVMQTDVLMQTLTVRQTLELAADLKINLKKQTRYKMVDQLIKDLKLQGCLDTLVGGVIVKGISGGQRKRTSIAFQLITDPQVIFLDEPTSGLDSLTSYIIIYYMRRLTRKANKTIIMTIHQPNTSIFQLFDDLLLLVEGKIIYQGETSKVTQYFQKNFNLKCPRHSNPPDFFMSKIHHESQQNRKRYPIYMDTYDRIIKPKIDQKIVARQTFQIQFRKTKIKKSRVYKTLSHRNLINTIRNPLLLKAKVFQGIFLSLFTGGIFFNVGKGDYTDPFDWQMLTGFLFFISINSLTTSLSPIAITFPLQRPVFIKQQDSKMYTIIDYSIARFIMDIPQLTLIPLICTIILYFMVHLSQTTGQFFFFYATYVLVHVAGSSFGLLIGSIFQDEKSISAVVPILILPLILFSGFFANRETLPPWISWFQYVSPIKYGFLCFVTNQVEGKPSNIDQLKFDMGQWTALFILLGLAIGFRVISIFFLWLLKSKAQ